jgi:DNA-damage-inducible protein D
MVDIGSQATREIDDVILTRYACYLIAQNGDPRKDEIAFAQTYFALQTRKQELLEERLRLAERLRAREKLVTSEIELSNNRTFRASPRLPMNMSKTTQRSARL